MEQNESKTSPISIDESTAREMTEYYKIKHDEFVKYIKRLGIEHTD